VADALLLALIGCVGNLPGDRGFRLSVERALVLCVAFRLSVERALALLGIFEGDGGCRTADFRTDEGVGADVGADMRSTCFTLFRISLLLFILPILPTLWMLLLPIFPMLLMLLLPILPPLIMLLAPLLAPGVPGVPGVYGV